MHVLLQQWIRSPKKKADFRVPGRPFLAQLTSNPKLIKELFSSSYTANFVAQTEHDKSFFTFEAKWDGDDWNIHRD